MNFRPARSDIKAPNNITIIGAGPAGALMAINQAKRGRRVTVFERLPDLRRNSGIAGRSINLALADRGIHALQSAGVFTSIAPLLVPMRGRMVHAVDGALSLLPYGHRPHEVIYSISRRELTAALLDHAEREHQVEFRFRQTLISVDADGRTLSMQDIPSGKLYSLPLRHVIGADGAGSMLRRYLVEVAGARCSEELLPHGYKELTIPAGESKSFQLDPHALHIWPRGNFMLIALPNRDGSFTATLFLPHEGALSFAALTTAAAVEAFFCEHFADTKDLLPDLAEQFLRNPLGTMGTVRLDTWSRGDEVILIGDAAHAIVPFHGQGMNCAFEDCVALDPLLATESWAEAGARFQTQRKDNCAAIADMALENYVEMRDTVRDSKFQLQKELSLELERRFPNRFVPRYSMIMFHHEIPYSLAQERGRIQNEILAALTERADTMSKIDFSLAKNSIAARLEPLDLPRRPAHST